MLTRADRIREMEANQGRQEEYSEANQGRQAENFDANQDRQPELEKSNDVGIYNTPLDSVQSPHDPTKQKAAEVENDKLYNGARCEGSFMRNSKEEDVHYIDKRCNDNLEKDRK